MTTKTANPIDALPDEGVDESTEKQRAAWREQAKRKRERAAVAKTEDVVRALPTPETIDAHIAELNAENSAGSGPVEIVRQPTNGKPTAAARKASGVSEIPSKVVDKPKSAKVKGASNGELKLGTDPVEIEGVKYLPVLARDGSIAERYLLDNYVWTCSSCDARLRAATCDGTKAGTKHKVVQAPRFYRASDRIIK